MKVTEMALSREEIEQLSGRIAEELLNNCQFLRLIIRELIKQTLANK